MADLNGLVTVAITVTGGLALLSAEFAPSSPSTEEMLASSPVREGQARAIAVERGADGRMFLNGRVNGVPARFLIDTAANRTVLSEKVAAAAGIRATEPVRLLTVGGRIDAARTSAATLHIDGSELSGVELLIVPGHDVSLLGMDALRALEGRYLPL